MPERPAVLQDAHKHFLHQVLSRRPIAGGAVKEVKERGVIALEQQAQLRDVAVANRLHQDFVSHGYLHRVKRTGAQNVTRRAQEDDWGVRSNAESSAHRFAPSAMFASTPR